jgi:PBP1b-binding outer membrane lipoprotein LpoB
MTKTSGPREKTMARREATEMKALFAITGLLLVFAFLAGCAQQPAGPGEQTPTPAATATPQLSEQEQTQAVDEFNNGLIDPDKEVVIGEMA